MDTGIAVGVRERKKAATRQALHEAALRLAMRHGLDGVTSEAVADVAGVSRRTFSNYFANKEEALLHGDQTGLRLMLDLVRGRPAAESAWTALVATVGELLAHLGDRDPDWVARFRLIRRHPSLAAYHVALFVSAERDLAAVIADRMPPDEAGGVRCRMMAAACLASVRIGTDAWLEAPVGTSLREVVDQALRAVAAPFLD